MWAVSEYPEVCCAVDSALYEAEDKKMSEYRDYIQHPTNRYSGLKIFICQMAKAKMSSVSSFIRKPKKKRPGVHSKCKQSSHKKGKNYQKRYVGQGKN